MYDEANMEQITKNILILHHILQELPEIEPHRKIMENISTHLSSLNLEEDADLVKVIQDIKKVEAERRTRGLPTTGKKGGNKVNRTNDGSTS